MIRIVSLTDKGQQLAKQIGEKLMAQDNNVALAHKPTPFTDSVQQWFSNGERLILITATGIAVRTLSPVLTDKYNDPAVLVLDEAGRFVIPLISGHEGGANAWGANVAELIGAQLVITTANTYTKPQIQPIYTVGLGCERDCPYAYVEAIFLKALQQASLSVAEISAITSIDIKADEAALLTLAKNYNKPFVTFTVAQLQTVENLLENPSEYVYNTVGVYGVAESAALYSAAQQSDNDNVPELALAKIKNEKATCAIARIYLN